MLRGEPRATGSSPIRGNFVIVSLKLEIVLTEEKRLTRMTFSIQDKYRGKLVTFCWFISLSCSELQFKVANALGW